MLAYRPSNRVSVLGFALLALTVLSGAAIGALAVLLGRLVYLILIFALGMGFLAGTVLAWAVRHGKVRNPWIAGLTGLLVGIVAYGSLHYLEYRWDRATIQRQLEQESPQVAPTAIEQAIDLWLADETGFSGFWGYTVLNSRAGVSIVGVQEAFWFGDDGDNLGPLFTWVYWLVEMVIVAGIPTYMGVKEARKPFCEACKQWYEHPEHVGGVEIQNAGQLLARLGAGDLMQVGESLDPDPPVPSMDIYLENCLGCGAAAVSAKRFWINSKGNVASKRIFEGMLSSPQRSELIQGFDARQQEAVEPDL